MEPALIEKLDQVKISLKNAQSVLVAFSGGVDSALLLALAHEALGDKAAAGTVVSPLLPGSEEQDAMGFAKARGLKHYLIDDHEMDLPEFLENPKNRCYICKKHHMQALLEMAGQLGFARVAHGANTDDFSDYRPGLQAAKELSIMAPLADAGLSKEEIRTASRKMGLETWSKPSMACLASRIPYGSLITKEKLHAIEKAEDFLRQKGFTQFRVRHHGDLARIEVPEQELEQLLNKNLRHALVRHMEDLGFLYVSLDLAGYQTGNLNKGLD